jgi:hypothetical protein
MAKTIANVLIGVATFSFKYPVGGAYVEFGYTEDGVTMEYDMTVADVKVDETTIPINRVITEEVVRFKANLSETSLTNIAQAMGGAVLAGNVITIGDGVLKEVSVMIVGTNPAGFARTIEIPLATAKGNVSMSFKKGKETILPVTFEALYTAAGSATITDAAS